MDKLVIEGGQKLAGSIRVSGAKNAALPILAATILTDETCTINGVPELKDVSTMLDILESLGCSVTRNEKTLEINTSTVKISNEI